MISTREGRACEDWGTLAARDGKRIFAAVRPLAPDDDLAWDCVQDALVTAVATKRPDELHDPVSWLCGVARNHARHLVRGRRRFLGFLDRLADRAPRARESAEGDDHEALRRALGDLPPKLRDAVILRHLSGMTIAEVATALRVSESAAKARIHRGLRRLRRRLGAATLAVLLVRDAAAGGIARLPALSVAVTGRAALLVGAAVLLGVSATLILGIGTGAADVRPGPPRPAPEPAPAAAPVPAPVGEADDPPARPVPVGTTVVRDLADGNVRTGLDLTFGSRELRSGPDGRIPVGTADLGELRVTTPGVELLEWEKPRGGGEPVAWVYGTTRLRGRVRGEGGDRRLEPTDVELRLKAAGRPHQPGSRVPGAPLGHRFLERCLHGRLPDLPPPEPDGTFDVEVPAIRGLAIVALAKQWRPAVADVPVGGEESVELVLRPAIRFVGALLREDGLPLSNVFVEIAVSRQWGPGEPVPPTPWGRGLAYVMGSGRNGGRITWLAGARTARDGRFEIWLPVEGEGYLCARPGAGWAPVFRDIGRISRDTIGFVVRTPRAEDAPRVVLRRGGRPLGPRPVEVRNLDLGGSPQPPFRVRLDEEGRISTAWLIRGHRYRIADMNSDLAGEFVWNEQDGVDLTPVPEKEGD